MKDQFNEEQNRAKYGAKENDTIALMFNISLNTGLGFVFGNIHKYLKRFNSDSAKSNNQSDIEKVFDYIDRLAYYVDKNKLQKLLDKVANCYYDRAIIYIPKLLKELINENNL